MCTQGHPEGLSLRTWGSSRHLGAAWEEISKSGDWMLLVCGVCAWVVCVNIWYVYL